MGVPGTTELKATPSQPSDTREAILTAALDAYSRYGFRGATTRRIAELAGVNEVTIFRHFGSKHALLGEAMRSLAPDRRVASLPSFPRDPDEELTTWVEEQLLQLRSARSAIRMCMGEIEERSELSACAAANPRAAFDELCKYFRRLRESGLSVSDLDETGAATTLMGALLADALGREMMPEIYADPVEGAPRQYARLILRAIGADELSRAALSDATGAPRG